MSTPDFYLASSEGYNMEEPRRCWRVRRVATPGRDDFLLVKIDPPLIGQNYGLGDRDVDLVLIATRHVGSSLFPINEWPIFVHVARPLIENPELHDRLRDDQFQLIAWAALYQTEEKARLKAM